MHIKGQPNQQVTESADLRWVREHLERYEAAGVRFSRREDGQLRVISLKPLPRPDRTFIKEFAREILFVIRRRAAQAADAEAQEEASRAGQPGPRLADPAPRASGDQGEPAARAAERGSGEVGGESRAPETDERESETRESEARESEAPESEVREVEPATQDARPAAVAQESEATVTCLPQCDDSKESHFPPGTQNTTIAVRPTSQTAGSATTSTDAGHSWPENFSNGARAPHPPIDPNTLTLRQADRLGLYRVRRHSVNGQLREVTYGDRWTHALGDEFAQDILAGRVSQEEARRIAAPERRQRLAALGRW